MIYRDNIQFYLIVFDFSLSTKLKTKSFFFIIKPLLPFSVKRAPLTLTFAIGSMKHTLCV